MMVSYVISSLPIKFQFILTPIWRGVAVLVEARGNRVVLAFRHPQFTVKYKLYPLTYKLFLNHLSLDPQFHTYGSEHQPKHKYK